MSMERKVRERGRNSKKDRPARRGRQGGERTVKATENNGTERGIPSELSTEGSFLGSAVTVIDREEDVL